MLWDKLRNVVQKIQNFKSWVLKGCLKDRPKILVGHRGMHLFPFFNNPIGWVVMRYKMSLTNALWSPKNGPPIPLWQVDDSSHLKLPEILPNLVSFDLI
jgi:hypothetical protein